MKRIALSLGLLLALAPTGCDPGDPNDAGPNGQLQGSVAGELAGGSSFEVALVWQVSMGSPDHIVKGASVELTGPLPQEFGLRVTEEPPPSAFNTLGDDESRFGVAIVTALPPGTDAESAEDAVLGWSEEHVVLYVDRDVEPGSAVARRLRGTPREGFHLMRVQPLTDAERAEATACEEALNAEFQACQAACDTGAEDLTECAQACAGREPSCDRTTFDRLVEEEAGFETGILVRLAPTGELRFPNWT